MQEGRIKILFIDDNSLSNKLTETIISFDELSIDSIFAESIDEAVELLVEQESQDAFPQYILSDINLPVKNGFDFVILYQEKFYKNHLNTKVVFLSATLYSEQTEKLDKFEFVAGFYEKPFSKDILDDILRA